MIVKVFTLKNGLEVIENVAAVRIKSKDYNLLILKDYLPFIGKIDGDLEIETVDGGKKSYYCIKAYFVVENNECSVLIEGE